MEGRHVSKRIHAVLLIGMWIALAIVIIAIVLIMVVGGIGGAARSAPRPHEGDKDMPG